MRLVLSTLHLPCQITDSVNFLYYNHSEIYGEKNFKDIFNPNFMYTCVNGLPTRQTCFELVRCVILEDVYWIK